MSLVQHKLVGDGTTVGSSEHPLELRGVDNGQLTIAEASQGAVERERERERGRERGAARGDEREVEREAQREVQRARGGGREQQ